ncbi:MAG: hypothetical protein ABIV06_09930 [Thermoanaerobaculia bacterium]
MSRHTFAATLAATLLTATAASAATAADAAAAPATADRTSANCPMHAQHMAQAKAQAIVAGHDHGAMDARGAEGMGFSQTATTHHFVLTAAGGEIRVEANDPNDAASRDQIRGHLSEIARSFAAGDFTIPMFVHAQTLPGVPELQRLKETVDYLYGDLAHGGRVEIRTTHPEALDAIHKFLRFQIEDHQTGDTETPAS